MAIAVKLATVLALVTFATVHGASVPDKRLQTNQNSQMRHCIDIHEIAKGQVTCSSSGCRMRCLPGYSFIASENRRDVNLSCDHSTGRLKFRDQYWIPEMTLCSPMCSKTCQNGGTCVAPNKCACQSVFTGDYCDGEPLLGDQPYKGYQPSGALKSNQRQVVCESGTRMPDGSTSVTLTYKDNSWFYPNGKLLLGVDQVTCEKGRKISKDKNSEVNKPQQDDPRAHSPNPPRLAPLTSPITGFAGEPMFGNRPYEGYQPSGPLKSNQRQVVCESGTRMPDGSTSVTLTYKDNSWFYPDGKLLLGVDQVTCEKGRKIIKEENIKVNKPQQDEPRAHSPNPPRLAPLTSPITHSVAKPLSTITLTSGSAAALCIFPCQNGGHCVLTNTCSCPQGYWGASCQETTCNYPRFEGDLNASLSGTALEMQFECPAGHSTKVGRVRVVAHCSQGLWRLPGGKILVEEDVQCMPRN